MKEKEKEITAQLKARLYIGGLKSLFGDMHDMIAEIEKTGQMPKDMLHNLEDVKEAIDLTVYHLNKATMKCCNHAADQPHDCSDDEDEEIIVIPETPAKIKNTIKVAADLESRAKKAKIKAKAKA
jgi:hypothetical protein